MGQRGGGGKMSDFTFRSTTYSRILNTTTEYSVHDGGKKRGKVLEKGRS